MNSTCSWTGLMWPLVSVSFINWLFDYNIKFVAVIESIALVAHHEGGDKFPYSYIFFFCYEFPYSFMLYRSVVLSLKASNNDACWTIHYMKVKILYYQCSGGSKRISTIISSSLACLIRQTHDVISRLALGRLLQVYILKNTIPYFIIQTII